MREGFYDIHYIVTMVTMMQSVMNTTQITNIPNKHNNTSDQCKYIFKQQTRSPAAIITFLYKPLTITMAERQDPKQRYEFTVVELFKNDTLGTGSYGAVCKAKCDQLLCAAKLLYPVLFQMQTPDQGKEHRRPFRRFEEECQFLSCINHPNIVQYLGTYRDPETNAPVLLMELMDESLTHFLESSLGDLPYHTQVNFSYDIAQAIAFLHANGIIHRDLSSNNVLLLASTRAKVTDFGMSKFTDLNTTRLATMTTCPGTPAFMSPEALNEPPVYTDKLDNFSFGVILVQIATRQFPKPTDRFRIQQLVDLKFPNQVIRANVSVPELERRQAHINLIPRDHPLLPTALHCLKDNDNERPTATQLCQTLTALKRTARYQESSQRDLHQLLRERDTQLLANQETIDELLLANQETLVQKDEQLLANQEQLQANENTISEKNEQLLAKDRELDQITQDIHTLRHEVGSREEQLRTLHRQLQSTEENCAALQQTIQQRDREVSELRQELTSNNQQLLTIQMYHFALQDNRQPPSMRPITLGRWQSLPDIPECMWYGSSAVIGDNTYFMSFDRNTVYELSNNQWNKLPFCPNSFSSFVSVDDVLTTVGGGLSSPSNKVYSYINNQWVEHFPPMPTKRCIPAAVYTNNTLVVAGGRNARLLTTVEILNSVNRQWSSVSSLPVEMPLPSATICRDYVYIHPRIKYQEKNSVYKCLLEQLVQSQPSSAIWEKITSLSVSWSSLVTINGHLLAVGGCETKDRTNNIYQYINTSWTVVGHMTSPRSTPLTAILSGNKLMVVGGYGADRKCELATIT